MIKFRNQLEMLECENLQAGDTVCVTHFAYLNDDNQIEYEIENYMEYLICEIQEHEKSFIDTDLSDICLEEIKINKLF